LHQIGFLSSHKLTACKQDTTPHNFFASISFLGRTFIAYLLLSVALNGEILVSSLTSTPPSSPEHLSFFNQ
jgi:hypothetical protein